MAADPSLSRWTSILLGWTLILNVVDATVTTLLLQRGLAAEGNPVLETAYLHGGVVGLIMIKSSLVAGAGFLLFRYREWVLATAGSYVCLVSYWSLMLWFWSHLVMVLP